MLRSDRRPVPAALPHLQPLVTPPSTAFFGDPLLAAYGAPLRLPRHPDRPAVVANFVSTLDGVVSYATPEAAGGGEISGFFAPDRLVMGMLRAQAHAVLVGAGTVRAAPTEVWTPEGVYPSAASEFAARRRLLRLPPQPTTVVVSGSGDLDPGHPGLANPDVPVIVVTTTAGARHLPAAASHVEVVPLPGERVEPRPLLETLHERGLDTILCEGGPHLLGDLVSAGLVDELFLTVAPQIAGRSPQQRRLALVEGVAFSVHEAPWWELASVARAGDHLFLRYQHRAQNRAQETHA